MELPKHAVLLKDAKKWINNWQNRKDIDGMSIKAHLIPAQDVDDIFSKDKGIEKFRGYNAITDGGEFKFLLVGVDDKDNDIVNYETGDYIYDMTTPCPSVCSANKWWES
ncbi:hypothetical protein LF887_14775 [Chryseobacterium sp. MEBOG06]|uniref:hypothetical protein n=1 Tax=unclassified Chryseobacterium TaxID=2593645 RepID=UPI001F22446E|nr:MULTISPECIES: hypothetical protein [unclassified Chryseobacterium]UKB82269.1 hypothetical protein LF887_14775 [Chryseobacterium sp. MEBOG06]